MSLLHEERLLYLLLRTLPDHLASGPEVFCFQEVPHDPLDVVQGHLREGYPTWNPKPTTRLPGTD